MSAETSGKKSPEVATKCFIQRALSGPIDTEDASTLHTGVETHKEVPSFSYASVGPRPGLKANRLPAEEVQSVKGSSKSLCDESADCGDNTDALISESLGNIGSRCSVYADCRQDQSEPTERNEVNISELAAQSDDPPPPTTNTTGKGSHTESIKVMSENEKLMLDMKSSRSPTTYHGGCESTERLSEPRHSVLSQIGDHTMMKTDEFLPPNSSIEDPSPSFILSDGSFNLLQTLQHKKSKSLFKIDGSVDQASDSNCPRSKDKEIETLGDEMMISESNDIGLAMTEPNLNTSSKTCLPEKSKSEHITNDKQVTSNMSTYSLKWNKRLYNLKHRLNSCNKEPEFYVSQDIELKIPSDGKVGDKEQYLNTFKELKEDNEDLCNVPFEKDNDDNTCTKSSLLKTEAEANVIYNGSNTTDKLKINEISNSQSDSKDRKEMTFPKCEKLSMYSQGQCDSCENETKPPSISSKKDQNKEELATERELDKEEIFSDNVLASQTSQTIKDSVPFLVNDQCEKLQSCEPKDDNITILKKSLIDLIQETLDTMKGMENVLSEEDLIELRGMLMLEKESRLPDKIPNAVCDKETLTSVCMGMRDEGKEINIGKLTDIDKEMQLCKENATYERRNSPIQVNNCIKSPPLPYFNKTSENISSEERSYRSCYPLKEMSGPEFRVSSYDEITSDIAQESPRVDEMSTPATCVMNNDYNFSLIQNYLVINEIVEKEKSISCESPDLLINTYDKGTSKVVARKPSEFTYGLLSNQIDPPKNRTPPTPQNFETSCQLLSELDGNDRKKRWRREDFHAVSVDSKPRLNNIDLLSRKVEENLNKFLSSVKASKIVWRSDSPPKKPVQQYNDRDEGDSESSKESTPSNETPKKGLKSSSAGNKHQEVTFNLTPQTINHSFEQISEELSNSCTSVDDSSQTMISPKKFTSIFKCPEHTLNIKDDKIDPGTYIKEIDSQTSVKWLKQRPDDLIEFNDSTTDSANYKKEVIITETYCYNEQQNAYTSMKKQKRYGNDSSTISYWCHDDASLDIDGDEIDEVFGMYVYSPPKRIKTLQFFNSTPHTSYKLVSIATFSQDTGLICHSSSSRSSADIDNELVDSDNEISEEHIQTINSDNSLKTTKPQSFLSTSESDITLCETKLYKNMHVFEPTNKCIVSIDNEAGYGTNMSSEKISEGLVVSPSKSNLFMPVNDIKPECANCKMVDLVVSITSHFNDILSICKKKLSSNTSRKKPRRVRSSSKKRLYGRYSPNYNKTFKHTETARCRKKGYLKKSCTYGVLENVWQESMDTPHLDSEITDPSSEKSISNGDSNTEIIVCKTAGSKWLENELRKEKAGHSKSHCFEESGNYEDSIIDALISEKKLFKKETTDIERKDDSWFSFISGSKTLQTDNKQEVTVHPEPIIPIIELEDSSDKNGICEEDKLEEAFFIPIPLINEKSYLSEIVLHIPMMHQEKSVDDAFIQTCVEKKQGSPLKLKCSTGSKHETQFQTQRERQHQIIATSQEDQPQSQKNVKSEMSGFGSKLSNDNLDKSDVSHRKPQTSVQISKPNNIKESQSGDIPISKSDKDRNVILNEQTNRAKTSNFIPKRLSMIKKPSCIKPTTKKASYEIKYPSRAIYGQSLVWSTRAKSSVDREFVDSTLLSEMSSDFEQDEHNIFESRDRNIFFIEDVEDYETSYVLPPEIELSDFEEIDVESLELCSDSSSIYLSELSDSSDTLSKNVKDQNSVRNKNDSIFLLSSINGTKANSCYSKNENKTSKQPMDDCTDCVKEYHQSDKSIMAVETQKVSSKQQEELFMNLIQSLKLCISEGFQESIERILNTLELRNRTNVDEKVRDELKKTPHNIKSDSISIKFKNDNRDADPKTISTENNSSNQAVLRHSDLQTWLMNSSAFSNDLSSCNVQQMSPSCENNCTYINKTHVKCSQNMDKSKQVAKHGSRTVRLHRSHSDSLLSEGNRHQDTTASKDSRTQATSSDMNISSKSKSGLSYRHGCCKRRNCLKNNSKKITRDSYHPEVKRDEKITSPSTKTFEATTKENTKNSDSCCLENHIRIFSRKSLDVDLDLASGEKHTSSSYKSHYSTNSQKEKLHKSENKSQKMLQDSNILSYIINEHREESDISTTTSMKNELGDLKNVLSKESKTLWKKLSKLEKSQDVCRLCKFKYESILSSHRPATLGTNTECTIKTEANSSSSNNHSIAGDDSIKGQINLHHCDRCLLQSMQDKGKAKVFHTGRKKSKCNKISDDNRDQNDIICTYPTKSPAKSIKSSEPIENSAKHIQLEKCQSNRSLNISTYISSGLSNSKYCISKKRDFVHSCPAMNIYSAKTHETNCQTMKCKQADSSNSKQIYVQRTDQFDTGSTKSNQKTIFPSSLSEYIIFNGSSTTEEEHTHHENKDTKVSQVLQLSPIAVLTNETNEINETDLPKPKANLSTEYFKRNQNVCNLNPEDNVDHLSINLVQKPRKNSDINQEPAREEVCLKPSSQSGANSRLRCDKDMSLTNPWKRSSPRKYLIHDSSPQIGENKSVIHSPLTKRFTDLTKQNLDNKPCRQLPQLKSVSVKDIIKRIESSSNDSQIVKGDRYNFFDKKEEHEETEQTKLTGQPSNQNSMRYFRLEDNCGGTPNGLFKEAVNKELHSISFSNHTYDTNSKELKAKQGTTAHNMVNLSQVVSQLKSGPEKSISTKLAQDSETSVNIDQKHLVNTDRRDLPLSATSSDKQSTNHSDTRTSPVNTKRSKSLSDVFHNITVAFSKESKIQSAKNTDFKPCQSVPVENIRNPSDSETNYSLSQVQRNKCRDECRVSFKKGHEIGRNLNLIFEQENCAADYKKSTYKENKVYTSREFKDGIFKTNSNSPSYELQGLDDSFELQNSYALDIIGCEWGSAYDHHNKNMKVNHIKSEPLSRLDRLKTLSDLWSSSTSQFTQGTFENIDRNKRNRISPDYKLNVPTDNSESIFDGTAIIDMTNVGMGPEASSLANISTMDESLVCDRTNNKRAPRKQEKGPFGSRTESPSCDDTELNKKGTTIVQNVRKAEFVSCNNESRNTETVSKMHVYDTSDSSFELYQRDSEYNEETSQENPDYFDKPKYHNYKCDETNYKERKLSNEINQSAVFKMSKHNKIEKSNIIDLPMHNDGASIIVAGSVENDILEQASAHMDIYEKSRKDKFSADRSQDQQWNIYQEKISPLASRKSNSCKNEAYEYNLDSPTDDEVSIDNFLCDIIDISCAEVFSSENKQSQSTTTAVFQCVPEPKAAAVQLHSPQTTDIVSKTVQYQRYESIIKKTMTLTNPLSNQDSMKQCSTHEIVNKFIREPKIPITKNVQQTELPGSCVSREQTKPPIPVDVYTRPNRKELHGLQKLRKSSLPVRKISISGPINLMTDLPHPVERPVSEESNVCCNGRKVGQFLHETKGRNTDHLSQRSIEKNGDWKSAVKNILSFSRKPSGKRK